MSEKITSDPEKQVASLNSLFASALNRAKNNPDTLAAFNQGLSDLISGLGLEEPKGAVQIETLKQPEKPLEVLLTDEIASDIASHVETGMFYIFQGFRGGYDRNMPDGEKFKVRASSSSTIYPFTKDYWNMRTPRLPYNRSIGRFCDYFTPINWLYSSLAQDTGDLFLNLPKGKDHKYASTCQCVVATKEIMGGLSKPVIYVFGDYIECAGRDGSDGFFSLTFDNDQSWQSMIELMRKQDLFTILKQTAGRLSTEQAASGQFEAVPLQNLRQINYLSDHTLPNSFDLKRKRLIDSDLPLRLDLFTIEQGFATNGSEFNRPISLDQVVFKLKPDSSSEIQSVNSTNDFQPPQR
ncbi:hypothetical protein A2574_02990 [Candidatus Shapirobacteria bacterium RIFOXYD1_FULL_38_32]|uniref:Uncharacterized protein n=2 Tax=Bacteria candidate phyla TaxID=1783234 RepID=A0A1F7ST36_9BACT|nr:MAG: hypothetical protein UU79_C0014G0011 [candidate division WWE3 bacterium GW2011_GWE1_41_72]KKS36755.1 MAG: hypothetical protein UV00_C0022G0016 [candidate division WWE3 bacterium GW2011_GWF1_42_14]OGL56521.1 MAG: hypothetical protein A2195_00570 [Candidatus Shapirobacteria bacterium RIFOXYA1_FULL_39_17]OGL56921.1 MAG: hypothetical protein A2367_02995 [Candidatus Shapirobacteria bacterium RIFOXYB1_FULL_38_38]OGL57797.1 MAG: hypothetical protein A2410_03210 [Candidatus Shapirobacteria bact